MQINEISFTDVQPVDSYGPGFFRVAGQVIEGPMVLTSQAARGWEGAKDHAPLMALAGAVDVLLIGTGSEIAPEHLALGHALEAQGLAVEVMATPAACRTYNVLASEGRRVALAALPV